MLISVGCVAPFWVINAWPDVTVEAVVTINRRRVHVLPPGKDPEKFALEAMPHESVAGMGSREESALAGTAVKKPVENSVKARMTLRSKPRVPIFRAYR
jgi:hypothetical protein